MKRQTLLFIFLFPLICLQNNIAQFINESNFEDSEIYFKGYYLNPFGLSSFNDVTLGKISDPYLRMVINPALIPDSGDKTFSFYFDLRGDRTPSVGYRYYTPVPLMSDAGYFPAPSHNYSIDRYEPQPLLSLGFIFNPADFLSKNFYAAVTYQIIRRDGSNYSSDYPIMYMSESIPAPGAGQPPYSYFPDYYGYYGSEDIFTEAHMFSLQSGYRLSDKLSFGVGANIVSHEKTNNQLDSDDYGYIQEVPGNISKNVRDKISDYSHIDFNGGINYYLSTYTSIGLKGGYLDGDVSQKNYYERIFDNSYYYNNSERDTNTGYSLNDQNWSRNGKSFYLGLNFNHEIDDLKEISAYYLFTKSNLDLSSGSAIMDTGYYSYRWFDSYQNYDYLGRNFLSELRNSTGTKETVKHEVSVTLKWDFSPSASLITGIFYKNNNDKIYSKEPFELTMNSFYKENDFENAVNENYYEAYEKGDLTWNSEVSFWTMQIPVFFRIAFDEYWSMLIGINKVLNTWKISEDVIKFLDYRYTNENGTIEEKSKLTERFRQPTRKITNDDTNVVIGFEINFSESLRNRIMFEPEFDPELRIAQWWLSFSGNL